MKSFSSSAERVQWFFRMVVPYVFMLLSLLVNFIFVSYPWDYFLAAPFFLMAVYYWSIYRPTLVPYWIMFIIGLSIDLLMYFPIGTNALLYVCVQWFVSSQRRFFISQSYVMLWAGFGFVSASVLFTQWVIVGVFAQGWVPLQSLTVPIILGVALFPLIAKILHLIHKILPIVD